MIYHGMEWSIVPTNTSPKIGGWIFERKGKNWKLVGRTQEAGSIDVIAGAVADAELATLQQWCEGNLKTPYEVHRGFDAAMTVFEFGSAADYIQFKLRWL